MLGYQLFNWISQNFLLVTMQMKISSPNVHGTCMFARVCMPMNTSAMGTIEEIGEQELIRQSNQDN